MKKYVYCLVFVLILSGIVIGQNLNESFSGEIFPPQGWTVHNFGNSQNNWARSTVAANYYSAPAGARVFINVNTTPFNEWLITPRLDLTASPGTDTLKCRMKTDGTFAAGEKYSIRLSTTNTDTASFTHILYTITTLTSGWVEVKIPLNNFETESNVYIAFQAKLSWNSYRAALDDISGPPLYTESIDVGTSGLDISSLPVRIGIKDTITATFKNFGNSTTNNFYGYFQVTGPENYLDSVLISALNPQQEINKEFYWTPYLEGTAKFAVYTKMPSDNIFTNDTTSVVQKIYQPFAIYESFEGVFPPTGWTRNDFGTAVNSSWDKLAFAPYRGQYVAACPNLLLKNNENYNEWLITPELFCSPNTQDTLQFYFRRGNSSPFSLSVRVSGTTKDTASFTATLLEIPADVPHSVWLEYKIPLDDFDDYSIFIAFQYKSVGSTYSVVQLDMVTAPSLYFSSTDAGVDSILTPSDSTIVTSPVQPRAIVKNFGTEPQTFDVKCEIDLPGQIGGNEYSQNLTITQLAPNNSTEITFPQWIPSNFDEQEYLVKMYTTLVNDEYPENDTLINTVWADNTPPTNDNFANAYYILQTPFADTSYTLGMTNDYNSYGIIPWQETGPDVVYAIVLDNPVDTLFASISGMKSELDIFLLNNPDPQSLVAFGSNSISYTNAVPDTYYIVIDGFEGAVEPPGSFVLKVRIGNKSIMPSFAVDTGWNMISLPVNVPDGRKSVLFPSASSSAFLYQTGYQPKDTLRNGFGYWLKFPASDVFQLTGAFIATDSIIVSQGWNMIGSISSPVKTATITTNPPGLISSSYYGYINGYYPSDTIKPGYGYWVKVNSNGKLFLSSGVVLSKNEASTIQNFDKLNRLIFTDNTGKKQTLYFGAGVGDDNLFRYELPPLPPQDGFDVRFQTKSGGSSVVSYQAGDNDVKDYTIAIQSRAYPITIDWEIKETGSSRFVVREPVGGKVINGNTNSGSGQIQIQNESVKALQLSIHNFSQTEIPNEYALHQNYPNPFNPTTLIKYDLPLSGLVTLKVFDVLGREVLTLVNEEKEAGKHTALFNSQNLSNGVYFYSLKTAQYNSIKKMILNK